MRIIFMTLGVLLFFLPCYLYADSDSELSAEILGEQGGKPIAVDHTEYQPGKQKKSVKNYFINNGKSTLKKWDFLLMKAWLIAM
jgi:hypothetical protein